MEKHREKIAMYEKNVVLAAQTLEFACSSFPNGFNLHGFGQAVSEKNSEDRKTLDKLYDAFAKNQVKQGSFLDSLTNKPQSQVRKIDPETSKSTSFSL